MAGDRKLPGERIEKDDNERLALHLVAIFVIAIVVLIIAGGVLLNEAGKNPPALPEKNPGDRDILYQVSTLDALVMGAFDGVQTVGEIEKHGDFGIGTFEAVDGEMTGIDGRYYQFTSDGSVRIADPSMMVPFATVTFFDNDTTIVVNGGRNLSTFITGIENGLPSKNLIYAVRADATFSEMVVRVIPRQEKPYPPLTEAASHQTVSRLENTSGTIVGFYFPAFMKGVNIPGFHLHYISSDRKSGGHVLDFTTPGTPMVVIVDQTPYFSMSAPTTGDFAEMNFTGDVSQDLERVERSSG